MFPEEVHRVEVLHNGGMIRVYTRRFMSDMITTNHQFELPGFSQTPRGFMGDATPISTSCY